MTIPKSKDIYTILLLLLFLCIALFLLRYIRSVEGFANPEALSETYNLTLFFGQYPLLDICPIYTAIFSQMVQGESTDAQGKPIPNDIATENVNKKVGLEVPIGVFPCPFSYPESSDLDAVVSYVEKLDPRLLSKAKNTLLFCLVTLETSLESSKNAVAQIPKIEGFITECSPEEIQYKDVVPLQCIPADVMKATEKAEIDKEDKVVQIQKVAKKQTIAKRLYEIHTDFVKFQESYKINIQNAVQEMKKQYDVAQATYELAKNLTKNSDDPEKARQSNEAKVYADKKKGEYERLLKYQKYMNLSIQELVNKCKSVDTELKGLQQKLESGNLTF